ncbi:DUF418 domain-containing protein [Dactylosporangium sp. NPDC000555]|uniref:DUF418 domain-containing protein n=1 Tax=Dactylosporangium sp. NPDC000555 TaxID=3154260 RepID=UPI003331F001
MTADMPTRSPGPMTPAARALAPDLARGFMLLFIALANSHYFLTGPSVLGGYPQNGSGLDAAVIWLISTFVDGRAFPMFGLLFGYGVARIVRRHEASKPRAVRRLLWRRSAALLVVGLLDALLFYVGDILAAYGVLLFLGAWAVRWRDRWLLLTALAFFVLNSLPSDGSLVISLAGPDAAMLPPDGVTMVAERARVALFVAFLGPLGFICPFMVGLWAGRRRILEYPERHRLLLGVTASIGIGAAVLGAQPVSLVLAGVVTPPNRPTLELLGSLHDTTGTLGGFGYAALLALIAARLHGRRRPVTDAIAATGQRSMTCYLMQSVIWAVAFTPFLLDLSSTMGVTGTALLATGTWIVTVVLADRMRHAGNRGPFESLVRRVTYGPGALARTSDPAGDERRPEPRTWST